MAVIAHPRIDLASSGIWLLLAAAVFAAAATVPHFAEPENLANIVRQSATLAILAIGQTFVIIAGLIDLSAGMAAGLVVVLTCALIDGDSAMTLPVVLLMLVLGAAIGSVNGILVNVLRIHPLILTFGMLSILQGIIFVFTDRSVGRRSDELEYLASGSVFGIPVAGLLVLVLAVGAHLLLTRTRFGFHLIAVGGSSESARRAGIDVARIRFLVMALSGLSAAAGGILLAGRLGTGFPLAGEGLELDAIVAVVLGGTSLAGGRGSIVRSIGGVLVLAIASNVLNLMAVSAFVQMAVKGLLVIIAILLNQPRRGTT
jgi:ribose/xylose/arabinose/galactoside ABC-type transport system permease subunit